MNEGIMTFPMLNFGTVKPDEVKITVESERSSFGADVTFCVEVTRPDGGFTMLRGVRQIISHADGSVSLSTAPGDPA